MKTMQAGHGLLRLEYVISDSKMGRSASIPSPAAPAVFVITSNPQRGQRSREDFTAELEHAMSPAEQAPQPANWGDDWTVGMRVWIERAGRAMLSEGHAELLGAIGRTHSISAAARSIGISYRHAWLMVQEVNAASGSPLVAAAVGGVRGGGAQLTAQGRYAVDVLEQLRGELRPKGAAVLRRIVAPADTPSQSLHLAAAISLQEVVGQVLTEYALRQPLILVRAVFGSSNELADHLLAGAPCDLFISADPTHLDRLEASGLLEPGDRRPLALNGLAAIGPPSGTTRARKLRDLLSDKIKHVALADPACPLGKLTQAYLQSVDLEQAIRPKAIYAGNSRGVLAAVQSGAAEAGLAFASDAAKAGQCVTLFQASAAQASAECTAAVPRYAPSGAEARALSDFFASPAARRCFRRCGFRPVKEK
jgi:molybdate transport system substrate-binding protein